jgi:predicted MFS family arabinose efflux permease
MIAPHPGLRPIDRLSGVHGLSAGRSFRARSGFPERATRRQDAARKEIRMREPSVGIVPEPVLAAAGVAADPLSPGIVLRLGRRMIVLSALSQNVASGLMFGSFGTLVVDIERKMHVDRGLSTAGAALVILAIGAIAPFLGAAMRRFGLRALLMTGALSCSLGYLVAALATNITLLLLAYALLVGPGIALLGIAVPTSLVANWFVLGRGKAIGIVNMPIAVALVPPITAALLPKLGLSGVYMGLAALSAILIPALLWVVDHPEKVGLRPHGEAPGTAIQAQSSPISALALVRTGDYWLLGLAAAMIAGGGATIATHIMPMAIGEGTAPALAALLISVLGASGVAGSLLYGMLADRVGGGRALAINAALQVALWCGLLISMPFALRMVLAGLIGINAGGMMSSLGTALSQRFGAAALGAALGLWSLMNLPFTVGMPPLAGALYARSGGYSVAFSVQIALYAAAAMLAMFAARRARFTRA